LERKKGVKNRDLTRPRRGGEHQDEATEERHDYPPREIPHQTRPTEVSQHSAITQRELVTHTARSSYVRHGRQHTSY